MDDRVENVFGRRMDIFRVPIAGLIKLEQSDVYPSNLQSHSGSDAIMFSLDAGPG
jgi:hypothetical protein